ncbi:MAG: cryptochrome/photolyase family protein [Saprospiraceae bacterium]|nr:cryptochrome/photolyase family protein [Saprospiraceae bacterium]MDW8231081.1 cryptochrome/photolyase family protein [Saprospiraceae bacterium]
MQTTILRLILGDQLNERHSWFSQVDDSVVYALMEVRSETDYVRHHVQKVVGFFQAMRLFAEQLRAQGHRVHYLTLDDPDNRQTLTDNCRMLVERYGAARFEYQEPDEYRVDEALRLLAASLPIETRCVSSEHFLSERDELKRLFSGKRTYLMERFYRAMREKWGVLMEADGRTPLTGRWNYDAENRKRLPPGLRGPAGPSFVRDVSPLVALLERAGVPTMGRIHPKHFDWPLTRAESLRLLEHFVQERLPLYGDYQDAMSQADGWLFHSRLSFSLNIKLISPLEVIQRAVAEWQAQPERIPFSALEGFVRQILGWREYVRGVYWAEMPHYRTLNFFEHTAPLPEWYWTGQTRMNCLRHAIGQSLDHAYAHHIQRLMVTGNFALLLGAHPDEVDAWYLGIYQDAIEWVELPNTRGMSQFADGGIVGTKPYVSSANYLQRMSDYCKGCPYDPKQRYGPRACPFNALYWDFYDRHADRLRNHPRIGMAYPLWDRMDGSERQRILEHAQRIKENVSRY